MIGSDYDWVLHPWIGHDRWSIIRRVMHSIYARQQSPVWIITNRPEGILCDQARSNLAAHMPVPWQLHSAAHKAPACRELGITVFIDDQVNNICELTDAGILVLVFCPFPASFWNFAVNSDLSIRIHSWENLEAILPWLNF